MFCCPININIYILTNIYIYEMGGMKAFLIKLSATIGWVMYVLKPPAFTQIMTPILHEHFDGGTLFSVKPSAFAHTVSNFKLATKHKYDNQKLLISQLFNTERNT